MNIYRQLAELPARTVPVVATIGNFDGVHLGHQEVIAEVIARARFLGGRSLAITFDPHPARVLRPDRPHLLITPLSRKLELLAATGIDATLVLPFTDELRRMPPRQFATDILANAVHITEIHEGENFRFGYQAEAAAGRAQSGESSLEAFGQQLGFSVVVYAPLTVRGAAVSSSRIRTLLAAQASLDGNVDTNAVSHARVLLGRPFSIDSTPAIGRGYGTKYAVPTINLAPYSELIPAHGVYITTLAIGKTENANTFDAVTNVGNRPTFGIDSFAVESHLLDFHPIDLDETTPLRLTFLRRLRSEQTFPSTQALRDQITHDVAQARRYFAFCHKLGVAAPRFEKT